MLGRAGGLNFSIPAGAGALAVRLYELARIFLAARLYLYGKDGQPPKQVVMHLCAWSAPRKLDGMK